MLSVEPRNGPCVDYVPIKQALAILHSYVGLPKDNLYVSNMYTMYAYYGCMCWNVSVSLHISKYNEVTSSLEAGTKHAQFSHALHDVSRPRSFTGKNKLNILYFDIQTCASVSLFVFCSVLYSVRVRSKGHATQLVDIPCSRPTQL
jgi:hypothetical protein